jgi:hypothetical protein
VQLRAARNRRAPPEVWQATFSWLGSQHLATVAPLQQAPKPIERVEARRQLWSPYLEFLAGSRHEAVVRRLVLQQMRAQGQDRRRARLLPQRALRPLPAGETVRAEPGTAASPAPAAARDGA